MYSLLTSSVSLLSVASQPGELIVRSVSKGQRCTAGYQYQNLSFLHPIYPPCMDSPAPDDGDMPINQPITVPDTQELWWCSMPDGSQKGYGLSTEPRLIFDDVRMCTCYYWGFNSREKLVCFWRMIVIAWTCPLFSTAGSKPPASR